MTLESSAWLAAGPEQSNYIVIDAPSCRLVNTVNVAGDGKKPVYTGWGIYYEVTEDTDPRTEVTRVRVRREGTEDWRDEYFRIEEESLHWQTPNGPRFHEWKRVLDHDLPPRVKAHIKKVLARMNE